METRKMVEQADQTPEWAEGLKQIVEQHGPQLIRDAQDASRRAVKATLLRMYKRYYEQLLLEDPKCINDDPEFLAVVQEYHRSIGHKPNSDAIRPWLLLTINPKKGTPLDSLVHVVAKILKKTWVTRAYYAYEQRSENPSRFFGAHVRMLVGRVGKHACEVEREIRNTCKHICDADNPHCIDFTYVTAKHFERELENLKGRETDMKLASVRATVIWREQNKLMSHYEYNASAREGGNEKSTQIPSAEGQ